MRGRHPGRAGHACSNQLEQKGRTERESPCAGDPPKGSTTFVTPEGGFGHASELAGFVKRRGSFCVAGACYPEKHPEATSLEVDMANLKRKVDAGAEFLITQLFFDNADYFTFVERARSLGITVPIIAGIMPVTNVSQIKRFTAMCGAGMPDGLLQKLEPIAADPDAVGEIGVQHAVEQCRELLAKGAPGVQFLYTQPLQSDGRDPQALALALLANHDRRALTRRYGGGVPAVGQVGADEAEDARSVARREREGFLAPCSMPKRSCQYAPCSSCPELSSSAQRRVLHLERFTEAQRIFAHEREAPSA